MTRLKKILRKGKSTVGLQIALAMLVPSKGKAGTDVQEKPGKESDELKQNASVSAPPSLTGAWDFSRLFDVAAHPEIVKDAKESASKLEQIASLTIKLATGAAKAKPASSEESFKAKPMSHEEARLWLQSFNAGPYACLKYKGDVPYKETMDYVPRVLKAYEENLPDKYDAQVNKMAGKYGLDPQMVKAIMKTESDFQNDTVSHAGARGLMQVMPVVWSEIKEKYDLDWEYSKGVFEPEKNIEVACAYLAWLRYDFLPRHFEAFEPNPDAPLCLVRDRDRGVPDRPTPRIVAKSAGGVDTAVEVASADSSENSKVPKSSIVSNDKTEKTEAAHEKVEKPRIEITDSKRVVKQTISNGKTRVVMHGGSGKSVAIAVSKGKVRNISRDNEEKESLAKKSKPKDVAKAKAGKEEESQGG